MENNKLVLTQQRPGEINLLSLPPEIQIYLCSLDPFETFTKYHVLSKTAAINSHFTRDLNKHGHWWLVSTSKTVQSGRYIDGREEGKFERTYEDGTPKMLCHFENGKRVSKYEEWHEGGDVKVLCHYENGKRVGEYREWYENGLDRKLYHYVDGKLHGEWKWWYPSNSLWRHGYYSTIERTAKFLLKKID